MVVRLRQASLVECDGCRSWNYFPRPSASGLVALHDDDDYFQHPYFENRRRQQERVDSRCQDLFAALGGPVPKGARLLDVGCGGGELLEAARRQFAVDPTGVDVARYAVERTREKGIAAIHGELADVPTDDPFQFIFAIDVIEHVLDPRRFLADISARLAKGGLAYLETPNHRSVVYGLGRVLANGTGGWPPGVFERLFPAQHVAYLSRDALSGAASAAGLELARFYTRTLPMLDVGGSWILRGGMGAVQLFDNVTGQRALSCLLLRKPN